jgi:hypothetical protein
LNDDDDDDDDEIVPGFIRLLLSAECDSMSGYLM